MKTCPTCNRPYSDETMVYCLADGARLVNVSRKLDLDATWRLSPPAAEQSITQVPPTLAAHQTAEPKPLTTLQYQPGLQHAPQQPPQTADSTPRGTRSVLPWIFAIVVVLAGSGVLIAWIVTRSRGDSAVTQTPVTTQVPATSPEPTAEPAADPKVEAKTAKNSDKSQPVNVSSATAPKNSAAKSQGLVPLPSRKSGIANERKTDAVSVKKEKKKEEPRPTGESFIPVKP